MIVADASALVEVLVNAPAAPAVGDALRAAGSAHAPEVVDLEVLQTVRRWLRKSELALDEAQLAVEALEAMHLQRHSHDTLRPLVWELRDRCSAYDAAYVALAARLELPLLTADARLARAVGDLVDVRLVA